MLSIDPTTVAAYVLPMLLLVIVLAVVQDLVERRISNVLTLGGLAVAIAMQSLSAGTSGFLYALAGAGVGFVCFLPLYLCKGMGAGDVKLMGAAGAFLGPGYALLAAGLSLAAGAVLALAVLAWRGFGMRAAVAGPAQPALSQLRKERFPYAAAIAAGVIATSWMSGQLEALVT